MSKKPQFDTSNEVLALRDESPGKSRFKRLLGGLTVAAAALLPLGFMAGGVANANPGINLIVGGAGDDSGQVASQVFHDNGTIKPGEYSEVVQYNASIGPIVGVGPMREAIQGGSDLVVNAVYNHLGQGAITVHCFSEGAAVCDLASNRLANEGVYVSFIQHGDGYGAAGIARSQLADTFRGVTDAMGVPNASEVYPAAGTVQKLDANDLWASNQAGDLGKIISNGLSIPQTHRIINPWETADEAFVANGVTYCVYSGTIPVPDGAELIGLPAACLPS